MRIKINPLFLLLGVYFALSGKIFIFISAVIAVSLHELGHSIAAAHYGYKLDTLELMPYGAVISGNIRGLKFKDEITVALAGPLLSLFIYVFFAAVWWFFPETYAFTDTAAYLSLSLAIINILPVFPLDGGRITLALLINNAGEKKAQKITKIISVCISVLLLLLCVISIFYTFNVTFLIFSLFLLLGSLINKKENKYIRMFAVNRSRNLAHGMEIKRIAVGNDTTVRKLMENLKPQHLNEVHIYDGSFKLIKVLTEKELEKICIECPIYKKLGEVI